MWMELAGRDVQLHHQLLFEEGEREAQLQDSGVDEDEGHPIGGPIVRADGHPSRRNADLDVEVVFPVDGAGRLIEVVAQQGCEVALGQ